MRAKRTNKKAVKASAKSASAPQRQSELRASDPEREVAPLIERVVAILDEARLQVVRTVNSTMVLAYWHVGREIVEFVQRGAKRAEYGEQVLEVLAARLRLRVGRGYSARNLRYVRSFYQAFANREPLIRDARGEFGTSPVQNLGHAGALAPSPPVGQAPSTGGARIRHEDRAGSEAALTGFSSRLSWTH